MDKHQFEIEVAAIGKITGTLKDHPELQAALEAHEISLSVTTPAYMLINICRALVEYQNGRAA